MYLYSSIPPPPRYQPRHARPGIAKRAGRAVMGAAGAAAAFLLRPEHLLYARLTGAAA